MRFITCLILIALGLFNSAQAQESQTLQKLDQALQAAANYEHGAKADSLRQIEEITVAAAKDPALRARTEEKLLATLNKSKSRGARSFICRQLLIVGTERSVPHLENLLTDRDLSHMARYVLARMRHPEAGKSLLRALDKTTGDLKIGVINSLGDRREPGADGKLIHYLHSSQADLVMAAANALGKIGSDTAVQALTEAQVNGSGKSLQQINNALIACADHYMADKQQAKAAKIYKAFYKETHPQHLRTAALRGLLATDDANTTALLKKAMQSAELRPVAIAFARDIKGGNTTRILTDLMPDLPADAQELLLGALSERADSKALSAVLKAAKSEHESVRVAALTALGSLGNTDNVKFLIETAARTTGKEQNAARASLLGLPDRNVNGALTRTLSSKNPDIQAEAIRALSRRKASSAVKNLISLASHDNENVRRQAIAAVGALATEEQLPALLNLNHKLEKADDLDAVQRATETAFRRFDDNEAKSKLIINTLNKARPNAQPNLIQLLSKSATTEGLKTVRNALRNDTASIRDAAIRTLAEWPYPEPVEDLLQIVTSTEGTQRILALRGVVRLAGLTKDPTATYVRAMDLADRIEDRKLVLAGLGSASTPEALKLARSYLKDADLQSEAGLATVQIAGRLRDTNARNALRSVSSLVQDDNIRKQARGILNEMEQYEGYILNWLVAGPYEAKGQDGQGIFNMAFPPEKTGAKVPWKNLSKGIGPWSIDLEQTFGSKNHCGAYMRNRVWSEQDQSASLELSSDDSIKVWLNGKPVHSNDTVRGLSPRQDVVKVDLKKGWNDLLLKVCDYEGGWAFACRIRNPDGSALQQLRVSTQ